MKAKTQVIPFRITIILLFFVLPFNNAKAKGVIIGHDSVVHYIFHKKDTREVIDLAMKVSQKYDKVIIHIGRWYPFENGGLFHSEKSQNNLRTFCEFLTTRNIETILWMLDSYGRKSFKSLYKVHEEVIDNAIDDLEWLRIPYHGIAVDMEWINHPWGFNTNRLVKVLKYMDEKIKDKKLYVFSSIIEKESHNIKRGFHENKIARYADNMIPMLYIVDGGFHMKNKEVRPYLHDRRVDQLRKYYDSKKYVPAISMNSGLVHVNSSEPKFVKKVFDKNAVIFESLELIKTTRQKYYNMHKYKVITDLEFTDEKNNPYRISKGEYVYFLEVKDTILQGDYFIWEISYIEKLH